MESKPRVVPLVQCALSRAHVIFAFLFQCGEGARRVVDDEHFHHTPSHYFYERRQVQVVRARNRLVVILDEYPLHAQAAG